MHVFKHPKYYTELRKRNRVARNPMGGYSQSDQAISNAEATAASERAPGQGLKPQALSDKPQAPSSESIKPQASSPKQQASSAKLLKHQATSLKPQATSVKLHDT